MQTNKKIAIAMLAMAACAAPIAAQASQPTMGSIVQSATHGAVLVDKTSPGPTKDLTAVIGHLKSDPARRILLWVVDGQYVLSGSLYNATGDNLSQQMAVQDGLIPKPIPAAKALDMVKHAHSFLLGKAGPVITAFEDPNCSACHAMNQSMAKAIDDGKVRVRVIPVGFLKPDSASRAAAILSARDPDAAWQQNESAFNVKDELGGYPVGRPPQAALAQVQSNTQLLSRVDQGQIATPTILYCDKAGQPRMMRGWQDSVLSNLDTSGCMPR